MFDIKPIDENLKEQVADIWTNNWGSDLMVTRGKVYRALDYPGYVAVEDGKIIGLIVFHMEDRECEILSLDSLSEHRGVGSKLLKKVIEVSRENKCNRVWLITSNDNTYAMKFYQKRRFQFKKVHLNAIEEARKIKPEIPTIGYDDIPIKHEIEMELKL
ncbi:GNAT family N-acetyltransferase [Dethiothermospora halolimnae]|uniref:GNAT family N-acetyltransferase n=1 Tax=Dethiothermospora halolimnae TaxID=3114390 RepID=UPI003CCBDC1C